MLEKRGRWAIDREKYLSADNRPISQKFIKTAKTIKVIQKLLIKYMYNKTNNTNEKININQKYNIQKHWNQPIHIHETCEK